ncbi:MAG: Gfo/Idh/MocA family oxidoreductase, partial [Devosiaceae bacterium]|nr:Gfo/Idh/MocA family oxidoreductase [Devosiaceae bacterium]
MNFPLGVGIIGCGNISTTYLELAPLFKTIKILAVADIVFETAAKRAKEYDVLAQSVDELLQNPKIDIIVNLTIPEAHFEVTRDIIRAGKHVYSEKPFVLSLEQGEVLQELSAAAKKTICSAPDTFLGGTHQQARHLLDAGKVGRITSGTCHLMSAGMENWHPNPDFFFRSGGGPVLDMATYYIANLINLVGPVIRVIALA